MSGNMKKFLELVSKNENLKKKMTELDKKELEKAIQEIIAIAKEHGIELSEADFAKNETSDELSDDELDAVAGGDCGCGFGGGGKITRGKELTCVCVLSGYGADDCFCAIAGAGLD